MTGSGDRRIPVYSVHDHDDRSHLPLGLGLLQANALADPVVADRYRFLPVLGLEANRIMRTFLDHGPGIWLFSNYLWSVERNLEVSRLAKGIDPRNLTIHGGPSTPRFETAALEFMGEHTHVDVAVRGEGESVVRDLLRLWEPGHDPTAVAGTTVREGTGGTQTLTRAAERGRATDPGIFPSPYLTGVFDTYPESVRSAIVETNRGCPYGCTFCDWGSATLQKVRCFDLERVEAEIEWIASRRIPILWLADANFGIFERDVRIAESIARTRERTGFPREVVVNYAKSLKRRLLEIVRIFRRAGITSQGILSQQTHDAVTLAAVRRQNIDARLYDRLGAAFAAEGLPVSTELMIGLPGATPETFAADLQHCFDRDRQVIAYRTRLLVNSPMADPASRREHAIEVDHDDLLISTSSYSREDLRDMVALWELYLRFEGYGVLRHVLRYLQWDHDIGAVAFLRRLAEILRDGGDHEYPGLAWVARAEPGEKPEAGGWRPILDEAGRLARREHGIPEGALDTAVRVNEAVLPEAGRPMPTEVELPHDFVAWVRERRGSSASGPQRRLETFPPGTLHVTDPFSLCSRPSSELRDVFSHGRHLILELSSVLSRPHPGADRSPERGESRETLPVSECPSPAAADP